jgi:hypothetical protein
MQYGAGAGMGLRLKVASDGWLREHERDLICPCGEWMRLRNTTHGIGYECPGCGLRHGAHQATGEPLGTPAADQETRQARIDAHEALDSLWRGPDAIMTRSAAYDYLAERAGLTHDECHIGRFTAAQCRAAIRICEELR